MLPDDHICLCFKVSQRKLVNFVKRTHPDVASQLSDCLGAGTGCGWCRPSLCRLFDQHINGEPMELNVDPEEYAVQRDAYRQAKREKKLADTNRDNQNSDSA